MTFTGLGLAEPLLRSLNTENYEIPTPIQAQAIPLLLKDRDLLGIAQTGTGKTAAFGLPILQKLAATKKALTAHGVRALILAPTRELAIQIDESLRVYGRHLNLRHTVVLGGVNQSRQVEAMRKGVDILVATPGRLLDLVKQRFIRLDHVEIFVVDEADRMLDMGFIRDVERIVEELPRNRHSMLFSATMPKDIVHLAHEMLYQPQRIDISPTVVTADKVDQHVIFVETKDKLAQLIGLLADPKLARVIVFTRTKHGANKVADRLEKARIGSDAIHGNKSQNARQRALENFRNGKIRVLVATDIAARGIDIDDVSHVINYELPNVAESYVHRIGRTARAGAAGIAISLCAPDERPFLRDIEKLIRRSIPVIGAVPVPESAGEFTKRADPTPPSRPKPPHNYARKRNRRRGKNGNGGNAGHGGNTAHSGKSAHGSKPQGQHRGQPQRSH
jgi:ATP-dependent RNA helicase RhlE